MFFSTGRTATLSRRCWRSGLRLPRRGSLTISRPSRFSDVAALQHENRDGIEGRNDRQNRRIRHSLQHGEVVLRWRSSFAAIFFRTKQKIWRIARSPVVSPIPQTGHVTARGVFRSAGWLYQCADAPRRDLARCPVAALLHPHALKSLYPALKALDPGCKVAFPDSPVVPAHAC